MYALLLCLALIALSIGTYCVWPSRWNVPAHMNLGFCVIAYIIPIYLAGSLDHFQPALVHFTTLVLALGAAAYVAGLYCGILGRPLARLPLPSALRGIPDAAYRVFVLRRTRLLAAAGLVGLAISFAVMGFIPALAHDPLAAKFFRGPYAAPYQRVEVLYRCSYLVMVTVTPLLFIAWAVTRRLHWAILTGLSVVAIALTLTRGPAAAGVLLMLGLLATRRRRWTLLFIVGIGFVYPIGALFYHLLGIIQSHRQNVWQAIAGGSSDVSDMLNFMFHFLGRNEFTHGKTFFGGMIPGHYRWNPAVYSLMVVTNYVDLNTISSGGLRLPAPVWGYTAFGWTGAALVPFVSGWIQARVIGFVRREGEGRDLVRAAVVLLFYATAGVNLAEFYTTSIYSLPIFAVYFSYLFTLRPMRLAPNEWKPSPPPAQTPSVLSAQPLSRSSP